MLTHMAHITAYNKEYFFLTLGKPHGCPLTAEGLCRTLTDQTERWLACQRAPRSPYETHRCPPHVLPEHK